MDERLKRLIAKREAVSKEREQKLAARKAIVDVAEGEAREDLLPEEDTEFRVLTAAVKEFDETIKGLDERIQELADEEQRSAGITEGAAAVRKAQARVQSVNEGLIYAKGNGRSYLRDLVRSNPTFGLPGADDAVERLQRHATDIATSPEFRDLNRTDGTGGYAVPPLWVMQGYVELARAGRATANAVTNMELPGGTDSINIPKMLTGTATAAQDGDNTAVQETDLTDTSITAGVKTISGQQDLAIQLIDQSPINFDEVVFRDLVADYATKVDGQVISGTNANGQVKGILSATGTNAVTYTDSAPTLGALYAKLADAINQVHTGRFQSPTVIVMHPRRWAWIISQRDSTGRVQVVPNGPAFNQPGTFSGVTAQGAAGTLAGLPVIVDPNIPTNVSTNQDPILVMKADDVYLWESSIRSRALPEVGSGTLTVRLQVYGYLAFTAERYPVSISKITGTGLATPSFV
ncbi:phage major capsid protein [Nocardioides sp. NPDC101246]|uniref:phage major capsid protein n=1 Tax=Nocardioides sp. NPDC101246 TaxID=3364336 RepID=UPI003825B3FC